VSESFTIPTLSLQTMELARVNRCLNYEQSASERQFAWPASVSGFSHDEQDADGGILDMISCARSYYVMQVAAEGQADWSQFNAN